VHFEPDSSRNICARDGFFIGTGVVVIDAMKHLFLCGEIDTFAPSDAQCSEEPISVDSAPLLPIFVRASQAQKSDLMRKMPQRLEK
jgi:hypothetical protein